MHHRLRVDPGGALAEDRRHTVAQVALLGGGKDQRAARTERVQFLGQRFQLAPAEYHAGGQALIDEGIHDGPQRLKWGGILASTLTHTERASV
ncbi:hypothetical protein D3C76_1549690 [compost metagenome]